MLSGYRTPFSGVAAHLTSPMIVVTGQLMIVVTQTLSRCAPCGHASMVTT